MGKKETLLTNGMLLTAALIWGSSYAIRKMGLVFMTPFFFNFSRFTLGALIIFFVALIDYCRLGTSESKTDTDVGTAGGTRYQCYGGALSGAVLGIAAGLQQLGLLTTTAGKAGFITSLYTLFVPILCLLIYRRKIDLRVWAGIALAGVGLILISAGNNFVIVRGDMVVFLAAIVYAFHVIMVSHFTQHAGTYLFAAVQMLVCGLCNLLFSLLFEPSNKMEDMISGMLPLLYTGVFTVAVAYILQTLAQRKVTPSVAAILYSFESVFSVVFGAILLDESMKPAQVLGCISIFTAILIAQINPKKA